MPADSFSENSFAMKIQNVICPFCGGDIFPGSRYCMFCGKDLSSRMDLKEAGTFWDPECTVRWCIACGKVIPLFARYCSECGQDQKGMVRPVPPVWTDDGVGNQTDDGVGNQTDDGVGNQADDGTDDQTEELRMMQRILEVSYIQQHGLDAGSDAADKLFPFGWFDCCDMTHIKALSEAIDKHILIRETETWNREMTEGLR